MDDDPARRVWQTSADVSVAAMAGRDLQLDLGANFGLNRHTPDVEVYAGVARRF
jgi:hypothetical protein